MDCDYSEIARIVLGDGEEFWTESCFNVYRDAAITMCHAGMDYDTIMNILSRLYSATSGEFGG